MLANLSLFEVRSSLPASRRRPKHGELTDFALFSLCSRCACRPSGSEFLRFSVCFCVCALVAEVNASVESFSKEFAQACLSLKLPTVIFFLLFLPIFSVTVSMLLSR